MRKFVEIVLLCLMFFVALPLNVSAEDSQEAEKVEEFDWNPVMDAIIQVESKGNPNARCGVWCGVLQISPALVKECNNILRFRSDAKRFKLSDRFNVEKSKEMFVVIQSHYNPENNVEKAIRMWNGGIGYSVRKTQRYYERVKNLIE